MKLTIALTDSSRREIIELLNKSSQGMTAKELAQELGLRISTVMSHLKILKDVAAIRSEKRTGKRVKRTLNRYYSIVQVRAAKQIEEAVEKAVDAFEYYLIGAALEFLQDNKKLVPRTSNPYYLAEWLDALFGETTDVVSGETIFINNARLAKQAQYRKLAVLAAVIMLFNDFTYLLFDYVCDLYGEDPKVVKKLAREWGQSSIKSEDDMTFVIELMFSVLYEPENQVTKPKNFLTKTLRCLPRKRYSILIRFWPFVLKVCEIPKSIKDRIVTSVFFGEEDEIIERCEANVEIIKKFGD